MLEISTNKYSTSDPPKTHRVNLHSLPVPGTNFMAHQLGTKDLFNEAQRLKVPGIEPNHGWQEIALRMGVFLQEQAGVTA